MLKGYIEPQDIAIALGYDLDDSRLMADVALAAEFCEGAVDTFCETQFDWEPGAAKVYDGTGTSMLTLGFYLRALTSVCMLDDEGGESDALTDVVAMPTPLKGSGAYRWLQRRQVLSEFGSVEYPSVFAAGLANVKVVGDWGFQPKDMPMAVRHAVVYGVRHFFDLRLVNDLVAMESGLGHTVVYKTPRQGVDQPVSYLPEVSRRLLTKWKNSRWMTE